MNPRKPAQSVVLLLGMVVSVLAVLALPDLYFHADLRAFWAWAQHWNNGWRDIYATCPDCNYPIFGMFASAGVIGAFAGLGYEKAIFIYRILLALVDGANVWVLFQLFRKFSVPAGAVWAGVVGFSLCSWVVGALWSQIDGIDQFLILLLLLLMSSSLSEPVSPRIFTISVAVSAMLLASSLMMKQLTVFSLFPLGLLLLASIVFYCRTWKYSLLNGCVGAAGFLLVVFACDPFLRLPAAYVSNLYYVWKVGSGHMDVISGNGFNIWMFLGRDMWGSSHIPILAGLPGLTPYAIGISLFVGYLLVTLASLFMFLRERFERDNQGLGAELLLNFIFFLALVNLAFNIFLTGTHERYLFHFYPYIILAWAGLGRYSPIFHKRVLPWLAVGANLYGLFVLQILSPYDFQIGTLSHLLMSAFHAVLLAYLTWQFLRYQSFPRSLASLRRVPGTALPDLP